LFCRVQNSINEEQKKEIQILQRRLGNLRQEFQDQVAGTASSNCVEDREWIIPDPDPTWQVISDPDPDPAEAVGQPAPGVPGPGGRYSPRSEWFFPDPDPTWRVFPDPVPDLDMDPAPDPTRKTSVTKWKI
jgi:hypothetical protein